MRKVFIVFMLLGLVGLPTATPWLPYSMVERLHVWNETHHGAIAEHGHSLHLDALTYFEDYLHIDLKKPPQQQVVLMLLPQMEQPVAVPAAWQTTQLIAWRIAKARPPDPSRRPHAIQAPIYLATQRIRV